MTREIVSAYDADFFAWTQDQAAALRRLPGSARPDDLAIEVQDLGRRDLRDATSNLSLLIKIESAPAACEAAPLHGGALGCQITATDVCSESMRRLIDLQPLLQPGRRRAAATLEQMGPSMRAPDGCPFALDEVRAATFEIGPALRRLASSAG